MQIINGNVFTQNLIFEKNQVCLKGKWIDSVSLQSPMDEKDDVYDAAGCYVLPGLTDIHIHGCAGHDFCEGTPDALDSMIRYQQHYGITTFCFATMTLPTEKLSAICENAAKYRLKNPSSFQGIYLEGPFLSILRKGAQNEKYIIPPSLPVFSDLQQAAGGFIKIITVAPESEGAFEFAKALKNQLVLSIGHSDANYDCALRAFESGFSHVTHLYHAMPPFLHRAPGIIGAAFDKSDSMVELICDGVHSDLSVIRATLRLFGDDRVIFISDSMMATGLGDGEYTLGEKPVIVKQKHACLPDGTIAGSVSNLYDCLKIAVSAGIPLESALKCAAVNPAKALGIYHQYGSISNGKIANLLILNEDLSIRDVFLEGHLLPRSSLHEFH